MLTLGLIINPFAGIGGAVGLKGSDGPDIVEEAFRRGATKRACSRARVALELLLPYAGQIQFLSCPGDMGQTLLDEMNFQYHLIDYEPAVPSTAADTITAARQIAEAKPDVLVFAGGDGTARDICSVIGDRVPVLGIPAGVKIHSGVYGISPSASGEVLLRLVQGQLVDIRDAEVRDLDEDAFRQDQVRARQYGEMRVVQSGHFVQSVKQGGTESEELVLADIAAHVIEEMEPGALYLFGSGKTTQAILDDLHLESTLLGVDAVVDEQVIASDLTEAEIWALLEQFEEAYAVVSVMGGQGHIFGRGNQQFSPRILTALGKDNFYVVTTKTKLVGLEGRPLVMDSGDAELDRRWAGTQTVITGYHDEVVYPLI